MKCERFLNKLETEDNNEEIDSNEDMADYDKDGIEDLNDFSQHGVRAKNKNKRAKNFIKTNNVFYLKLCIALLSIEAYFAL